MLTGAASVVICGDTAALRHLCTSQLRRGDSVVDVGASTGMATQAAWRACGRAVGVDVSKELLAVARRDFPHLTCASCHGCDCQRGVVDVCCARMRPVGNLVDTC